jgi:hypothetical protein
MCVDPSIAQALQYLVLIMNVQTDELPSREAMRKSIEDRFNICLYHDCMTLLSGSRVYIVVLQQLFLLMILRLLRMDVVRGAHRFAPRLMQATEHVILGRTGER